MKPKARTQSLVVQKIADETIVYDVQRHRAHCLNKPAALVWESCDGTRTVDDIARMHADSQVDTQSVWLALQRLDKARLMEGPISWPKEARMLTRRSLLKKFGLAAALVPLVSSLVVPTAAQAAASCAAAFEDCSSVPCCGPETCVGDGFGNFICS